MQTLQSYWLSHDTLAPATTLLAWYCPNQLDVTDFLMFVITPFSSEVVNKGFNYISQLVSALLVMLAGRILLYGCLLPKCFVIYCQVFLTFLVSKRLKLSFTFEIVYKNLLTT